MSQSERPTPSQLQASQAAFQEAASGLEASDFPDTTFTHLVLSLQHAALVHLGDAPAPGTDERERDLALARQDIDLLALLNEKTYGNLTGEEEHLLHQALFDLRVRFVEVVKRG